MRMTIGLCLVVCLTAACARRPNGVVPGERQHYAIKVKLKRAGTAGCDLDSVSPMSLPGLRPGDTVFWRVTNPCRNDTPVKISFTGLDPVYDYPGNPDHRKTIPGGNIFFPGMGAIETAVLPSDPGGKTGVSVRYQYDVVLPTGSADPELIIDWP